MRWLILILAFCSCQDKVDDSDFVTAYLEREGHLQVKPRKFYGLKVVDRSIEDVVKL